MPRTLFAFGINHKTAPVEVREKLYLHEAEIPAILKKLKETLSECLILSTCNRTEIYAVSESTDIDLDFYKGVLVDFKNVRDTVKDEHFFAHISCVASKQLFSIATSIESSVIGDSQILRQVRSAYQLAQENAATGKILHQLMQRALKLGKRTCTETPIRGGMLSVSRAAVMLALDVFGTLEGRNVLVVGAGETARLAVEALAEKNCGKILITNRTRANAEELLLAHDEMNSFNGDVIDFDDFKNHLGGVDIVITSTSATDPILRKNDFAGVDRKMLVIDIALPRNVDVTVGDLPSVTLRNIDELNSIVDGNQEKYLKDLPKIKEMIREEMIEFLCWYYLLPLLPEYEKSNKPTAEQKEEVLKVKRFLNQNLGEIHRLSAEGGGDFTLDLESHLSLIQNLQMLKAKAFAPATA